MPLEIVNGYIIAEDLGSFGPPIPLTVTAGVISISGPGFYELDGASSSNDLNTINGGSEGDEIILKIANNARNVVVTHGTGGSDNIDLIGLSITMDTTNQRVKLQRGATNWVESSSRP